MQVRNQEILKLMIGGPGSGKTNHLKWELLEGLKEGRTSIFFDYSKLNITEELIEILPKQMYQLWDLEDEKTIGILCFQEMYQRWEEKTEEEKRDALNPVVDDMMISFQALKSEQMKKLSEVEKEYLKLILKMHFSTKYQTIWSLKGSIENYEKEEAIIFLRAIKCGILTSEEIEFYRVQQINVEKTYRFLSKMIGEQSIEMLEFSRKNESGPLIEVNKPQIILIKYSKMASCDVSIENRLFVTSMLMNRIMSAIREGSISTPIQFVHDEVVERLGFGIRHQLNRILELAPSLNTKLIVTGYNLPTIKPLFGDLEGYSPTYNFCGCAFYSKDFEGFETDSLKTNIHSYLSKAGRKDVLELIYESGEYLPCSKQRVTFTKENFENYLISQTFKNYAS